MRRVLLLAALALVAPVQADLGHVPSPVVMHIHFAGDDVLAMQPMAPTAYHLRPAPDAQPACGSALEWHARFTQVPVHGDVVWRSELARDALLGGSGPSIKWYVETVQPGSGDPLSVPVDRMRLQGQMLAGDRLLADGEVIGRPSAVEVEGRHVHRFDLRLSYANETVQAAEGLDLVLRLDMLDMPCTVAPPAVRAYADPTHSPTVSFAVYDPVQIDLLEPRPDGQAWRFVWHASSPWGRFDLQEPEVPAVRGPAGQAAAPMLVEVADADALQTVWSWDPGQGPNGTYRVDVVVRNLAGDEAAAGATFRVGSDAPPPSLPPPAKQSPGLVVPVMLACLAIASKTFKARREP